MYGGVKLADFLGSAVRLEPQGQVTFVASDGYRMSYGAEQILDDSDGIWILAFRMDGEELDEGLGPFRTVKIARDGSAVPNIDGHLSVKMVEEVRIDGESYSDFTLSVRGLMDAEVDRQTFQSGVSAHGRTVMLRGRDGSETAYTGVPLWMLTAYSDDPNYAPHRQDSSIVSYSRDAAEGGYSVVVTAADGFSVTLDSRELAGNDDVVLAMYREGRALDDREFPLVLAWNSDAEVVPEGIKAVRNVVSLELIFP